MNIALWIAQGLIAAILLFAGLVKVFNSKEKLLPKTPNIKDMPAWEIKATGIVDLLGATGLIVPGATGIVPVLTPIAATGTMVLMALAIRVHLQHKDAAVMQVILLLLAGFVAYGRFAW